MRQGNPFIIVIVALASCGGGAADRASEPASTGDPVTVTATSTVATDPTRATTPSLPPMDTTAELATTTTAPEPPPTPTLVSQSVPATQWAALEPDEDAYSGPLSFSWPADCTVPVNRSSFTHSDFDDLAATPSETVVNDHFVMQLSSDSAGTKVDFTDQIVDYAAFDGRVAPARELPGSGSPLPPMVLDSESNLISFNGKAGVPPRQPFLFREWAAVAMVWQPVEEVTAGSAQVMPTGDDPLSSTARDVPLATTIESLPAPPGRARLRWKALGASSDIAAWLAASGGGADEAEWVITIDAMVEPATMRPDHVSMTNVASTRSSDALPSVNSTQVTWELDWSGC